MAFADQLNPLRVIKIPNSEQSVAVTLVPQHKIFELNKEVDKYLLKFELQNDLVAKKQAQEAALLISSLRKPNTVNLAEGNRGEPMYGSIEEFFKIFSEGHQDFFLAHYLTLEKEAIPSVAELTPEDQQKLLEQVDSGKDISPQLTKLDFASLLSFTISLVSRLGQLREASPTRNSQPGFFLSEKRAKAAEEAARRQADDA